MYLKHFKPTFFQSLHDISLPVRIVRVAVRIVQIEVSEDDLNSLVRLRH